MRNPWLDLPHQAPFVLAQDAAKIVAFNRNATDRTRIHVELFPEPFFGSPGAPIVLLLLNPGFSDDDPATHADSKFAQLSRTNLEQRTSDYPFYLINPAVSGPGRQWWDQRLRRILEVVPRKVVAGSVLCVQYFGYHSHGFDHDRLQLSSQQYGFFLVRQAVSRRAIVVLTRSHRPWFEAVPNLAKYSRLFSLRNVRNTAITPGNCPTGFDEILTVLRDCAREQSSPLAEPAG